MRCKTTFGGGRHAEPVLAARGVLVLSKKQVERVDAALKLIGTSLNEQFPNCDIVEYDDGS